MKIGIVIPCYKVKRHILSVLDGIGDEAHAIYVVDDGCPEGTGDLVEESCRQPNVRVLRHDRNKGVGGAVMTGYRQALADGMDILVKLDGDGQMDPALVPALVRPILNLEADYVKGNRFGSLYDVSAMPRMRLFGNAVLSFVTKFSSGYWRLFDPTNGFTAISAVAAKRLDFEKISARYFFETDMLINLGSIRAVVRDFPMQATYRDEVSNLRIRNVVFSFAAKHIRLAAKRLLYTYFLRDFSIASVNLVFGLAFLLFGTVFGGVEWYLSVASGVTASTGTVMIAVLPIILGVQLLIAFLSHDIGNDPTVPLVRFHYQQRVAAAAAEPTPV